LKGWITADHMKRECQDACLLGRVLCEGQAACLASADYQEGTWSLEASADGLAARKMAPGMRANAWHSGSKTKLRDTCSTAAQAQGLRIVVKCAESHAQSSSDMYLEAIATPRNIAQPKHKYLTHPQGPSRSSTHQKHWPEVTALKVLRISSMYLQFRAETSLCSPQPADEPSRWYVS